ncbi:AsmA-like C-terminal region-containing protein [Opitutus sp. ER46]|uniref:AsmA-like C-terminal region-containing protein n=1 Tax=Opitutus sp. ER46 TaxID=2161864 RepID=UPI000D31BE05|nr:AsmA-like C-terminal region-containing protein [Opitutus sp. ER46]PTX99000.1 hypothetical protein DB354_02990 [Opitutus sp. ER46]
MKPIRLIVISASVVAALVLLAAVVVFSSAFQTWAFRRAVAGTPGVHLAVERVSAGFRYVDLTEIRYEEPGLRLHAPAVHIELDVLRAVWSRQFAIASLTAEGWTVTLVEPVAPANVPPSAASEPARQPANEGTPPVAASGAPAALTPTTFAGVFDPVRLPYDLAVDHLAVRGQVILPADRGRVLVDMSGGGLGAGRRADFKVNAKATFRDETVNAVTAEGNLVATMDTPRTLTEVGLRLDATASGGQLTAPVPLHAELGARRSGAAETYSVRVTRGDRRLAALQAEFPNHGKDQLTGAWQLDVRHVDLAPFALGWRVPQFSALGEGTFETEPSLATVHATGKLDATFENLAVLKPDLAVLGAIKLSADLDVARQGDVLTVGKLDVAVATSNGGAPAAADSAWRAVGTIRALQPFQFTAHAREVSAADPARDLIGIALEGLPLEWLRPIFPQVQVTGSNVRGELVATPRAGGFSFRTRVPLIVRNLELRHRGKAVLQHLDLSLSTSGDFTPEGWQAEVNGFTARSGEARMLLLDAKAGQLAGANQPIKATGLLSVDLGALLAQPLAAKLLAIDRGDASIEFAASLGRRQEIQANVRVKNLGLPSGASANVALPAVSATVRADIAEDGTVTVNVPVTLVREERTSDVTVAGTYKPARGGGTFDGHALSQHFDLGDARVLGEMLPPKAGDGASATPAWAGLKGTVGVQLKELVYSRTLTLNNVIGTLRLSGDAVKFDNLRAAVGEGGAQANGAVTFSAQKRPPYGLNADLSLSDVDPGPLLASVNPGQPPTIEGRFTINSHLQAAAASLEELSHGAAGDFQLTSRSGVFRGLSVNVGNLVENSSKLATWLASAGHAITSLAGKKPDYDEITSRSQAANELARILSAIAYDQLSIVVSRDALGQMNVKEITLISPEIRITGTGRSLGAPGRSLGEGFLALEYQLRARGRPAELMKYLGVLDPKPDNLGYASCTIPVRVQGTLAKVDTTELSNRLVALAVEKTGLTEKAVDWINRLRGK